MRLRSYWKKHPDLYDNHLTNGLYELVDVYGAYVEWKKNSSYIGISFEEYYDEKKGKVKFHFITIAHEEFQKYCLAKFYQYIPKRKMRNLIVSNSKKFVITYDWMPKYLDFFTDSIESEQDLKHYVDNYFYKPCCRCTEDFGDSLRLRMCKDKILGYQYDLLARLKENGNGRDPLKASKILEDISIYDNFHIIISNCVNAQ